MRLLCEQDVERLVDPAMAITSAAEAYRQQASGTQHAPGRLDLPRQDPTGNVLVLAGQGGAGLFCSKNNAHGVGLDFNAVTGETLALAAMQRAAS